MMKVPPPEHYFPPLPILKQVRVKVGGCDPEEELCHQSSERGTASGRPGAWPGPGLAPCAQHPVPSAAAASTGPWGSGSASRAAGGDGAGRCLQAARSQRALRCNRDRLVWHRQMQQFRATTDTGFRLGFCFFFFSSSPWLSGSRALTFGAHFSAQCSGGGGAAGPSSRRARGWQRRSAVVAV